MRFFVALCCAVGAASLLDGRVLDRKDVRLDNNRFMPALISARAGDTLAFINGRGGPHNVQFADDSLSDEAHRLIDAAMPERPRVAWVARRAAGRSAPGARWRHVQGGGPGAATWSLPILLHAASQRRHAGRTGRRSLTSLTRRKTHRLTSGAPRQCGRQDNPCRPH